MIGIDHMACISYGYFTGHFTQLTVGLQELQLIKINYSWSCTWKFSALHSTNARLAQCMYVVCHSSLAQAMLQHCGFFTHFVIGYTKMINFIFTFLQKHLYWWGDPLRHYRANKSSKQKFALQYVCAPAGPIRWCRDKPLNSIRDIKLAHAYRQFNPCMRFLDKHLCHRVYKVNLIILTTCWKKTKNLKMRGASSRFSKFQMGLI